MNRDPISRQRSRWVERDPLVLEGVRARVWQRRVHDGVLSAILAEEPGGWHLSVSHKAAGKSRRYPSWDEIAGARYELAPDDIDMVMWLPKPDRYVALHDTTFQLLEHPPRGGS